MNTQEKIVEILREHKLERKAELIASEIAEMIDKRDEIIEAQDELLKIDRNGFRYIEKHYGRLPVHANVEIEQSLRRGIELRQKVEQLKSEI